VPCRVPAPPPDIAVQEIAVAESIEIMNKKELIAALESLGMRPGRGLGQNFLLDGNLLDWIIRNSGAQSGDNVLEVGPGFGALTEKMVDAGFNVTAVEFDHRLAEYLRKKFNGRENFKLIEVEVPGGYTGAKETPVSTKVSTTGTDAASGEKIIDVTITNTLGTALPETGGMGTTLFYGIGGLMVAAAAVLLVTKKRADA
jgi:LPXTG-motif cell wall-anchored protein